MLHAAREHALALEIDANHSRSTARICACIGHANWA